MKRAIIGLLLLVGLLTASPIVSSGESNEGEEDSFLPSCAVNASDGESAEQSTAGSDDAFERPEWQTITLTEVNSGEDLSVADLEGCPVIFEPMATWCINCFQQLTNVAGAVELLDPDTFAVVVVSVEVGLENDMLREYAEQSDFDFYFVVASAEMLRAIDAEFGRSALNPPATPHVYIAPDGTFSDLHTGGESPEDIVEQVEALTATEDQ